jgi:ADP-ribosylglycohydrolase
MAGATAGAYYGYGEIPEVWVSRLENRDKGRDYVINCVKKLITPTAK